MVFTDASIFIGVAKVKETGMTSSNDRSTWAIGGGLLAGLGVGFFVLQTSALYFVGALIAGLGVGLVVTAVISGRQAPH